MRTWRERLRDAAGDDEGSSTVEFVLVGIVLTALTFGVLQFGLAIYVRNVVHDAAVEGAYQAALADTTLEEGVARTKAIVARTVGSSYPVEVRATEADVGGASTVELTVRAALPLFGVFGLSRSLEVTAHAPAESF